MEKVLYKMFLLKKLLYQMYKFKDKNVQKRVLFIFGCQRSGTTLMIRIFERDFRTKVYGEFSKLFFHEGKRKLRFRSLDFVKKQIENNGARFVVLKPLVETQNSQKLLEDFPCSKALWMYRQYKAVVSSNLKQFGMNNGINNLRAIVEGEIGNWRFENLSEYTKTIVTRHFSETMNPYDAAALFWFARNRLFFEQGLAGNPNVMMCKYEDLVGNPGKLMRNIYEFAWGVAPAKEAVFEVHKNSLGKGKDICLSPEINKLCEELQEKLHEVFILKGKNLVCQGALPPLNRA